MEKEAYHKDLISDGVHVHFALKTLVEQYLSGTHVAPPPLPSLRAGADEIRHRLPQKRQYNKHLQEGRKIIEGRINSGIPASISERERHHTLGVHKSAGARGVRAPTLLPTCWSALVRLLCCLIVLGWPKPLLSIVAFEITTGSRDSVAWSLSGFGSFPMTRLSQTSRR